MFRPSAIACAVACAFVQSPLVVSLAHAQSGAAPTQQLPQQLPITEVSGTRLSFSDTSAPYANEVYTRADIEASGASSLAEFLAKASLVGVSSAFGNNLAPNLDIRGFGIEQGTRAVGIVLDGRPITGIDSANTFLSQVPLSSVKSIEVTRGYGAAARGEGAIAGTIVITTEMRDGAEIRAGIGSNQLKEGGFSVAQTFGIAQLAASVDTLGTDGSGTTPTGQTDSNFSRSQQASLGINISPRLNVKLSAKATDTQVKYPNPISVAQFRDSPKLLAGGVFAQRFELDEYGADFGLKLSDTHRLALLATQRESASAFGSGSPRVTDESFLELNSSQRLGAAQLTLGASVRNAERENGAGSGKFTSRDLAALFATGSLRDGRWTYIAGLRGEAVNFKSNENAAPAAPLKDTNRHVNVDASVSYAHSDASSTYLSLARGVQTPDIDNFFTPVFDPNTFAVIDVQFNAFIAPARAIGLTLGHNTVLGSHSLKGSVFYARLRDEIYFDGARNTNIDRSHKYGVELQDQWRVARGLDVNLAGSYVRAVIDEEGSFSDRELPGVPKLNLKAGISWNFAQSLIFDANTSFRSGSTAFSALQFPDPQRQFPERSTDAQIRYLRGNYTVAAGVSNIFDQQNGLVSFGQVYPTLTERTFFVRGSAKF